MAIRLQYKTKELGQKKRDSTRHWQIVRNVAAALIGPILERFCRFLHFFSRDCELSEFCSRNIVHIISSVLFDVCVSEQQSLSATAATSS
jgi:hypothetical protein